MNIASHIGTVPYTIDYQAVGDTLVLAQVRYFAAGSGAQVTVDFSGSISIVTSNSIANIEVRFKGVPLGSAVQGSISP